jgi:hypothetical protein
MKKYQDTQKQLLRLVKKTYIIYTIFLKKASYQCFNYWINKSVYKNNQFDSPALHYTIKYFFLNSKKHVGFVNIFFPLKIVDYKLKGLYICSIKLIKNYIYINK